MSTLKFCKDCKHYKLPFILPIGVTEELAARCRHGGSPNLVTGTMNEWHCSVLRHSDYPGHCGISGRFWEAKA